MVLLRLQIVTDYRLQLQANNSSSPPGGPRGLAMHGLWIYIHIFVAVCAQAQELIAQSMVWRDRSHSPRPMGGHNGHRCSLAINTAQKEQIEITSTVLKEWFGNGTSVPVKDTVEAAATKYYVQATKEAPDFVLTFFIPLRVYHKWIDQGIMTRVRHVYGYRIETDLNLNDLDLEWKVLPTTWICTE